MSKVEQESVRVVKQELEWTFWHYYTIATPEPNPKS